ncbi:methyltransferase [Nocardia goodfellowii]
MTETNDALAVRFLIYGRLISEAVCTFASLGLPDMIDEKGCDVKLLAEQAELDSERLLDLLRLLEVCELVRLAQGRVWRTERGDYLCADRPGSVLPTARLVRASVGRAWDGLETTLRTGLPAFDTVYGRSFFAELDHNRDLRAIFDESQAHGLRSELDAIGDLIAAAGTARVLDIGGGDGYLLTRLLTRFSALTGVLVDRETVLERGRARLAAQRLTPRCSCVAADFFAPLELGVTPGDVLIMRHILHDWDDPATVAILANCRAAMPAGTRLLVVEHFSAANTERRDPMAAVMSLYMATVTSGRERTLAEYEKLHSTAGLAVSGVTLSGGACLIESRPV